MEIIIALVGVVAVCAGTRVYECSNSGKVIAYGRHSSNGTRAGGITAGNNGSMIINCQNYGEVIAYNNARLVAGIAAYSSGLVENCQNYGKITSVDIENSSNTSNWTGGIVGQIGATVPSHGRLEISDCSNFGDIIGNEDVGGIVAGVACRNNTVSNGVVSNCYNLANIRGINNVGGIVGSVGSNKGDTKIISCYNKGLIDGNQNKGAIIGDIINRTVEGNNIILTDLYYQSTVGIGAINGEDDSTKYIGPLTAPDGNFNSKEEFLTWLDTQKASRTNT